MSGLESPALIIYGISVSVYREVLKYHLKVQEASVWDKQVQVSWPQRKSYLVAAHGDLGEQMFITAGSNHDFK